MKINCEFQILYKAIILFRDVMDNVVLHGCIIVQNCLHECYQNICVAFTSSARCLRLQYVPSPIKPLSHDRVFASVHRRMKPRHISCLHVLYSSRALSDTLVSWLVVFNVPSIARSFRDGTHIYCPLRRTGSSVLTPYPPRIEPRVVAWNSHT